jgi:hypothetical protein
VKVVPEDLPWELLFDQYKPSAHAYFVSEVEKAAKNASQDNAKDFALYWGVHPVWMIDVGGTPSSGLHSNVKPVKGAAWFASKDLAMAYFSQISVAWRTWTLALGLDKSCFHTSFMLAGPWTRREIVAFTTNLHGTGSSSLLISKKMDMQMMEMEGQRVLEATRLNELNESLSQESKVMSGYRKLLFNEDTGTERFPHWWVAPSEIPPEFVVAEDSEEISKQTFYNKSTPWAPAVVVPWVQRTAVDNDANPVEGQIHPAPQPLAYFEHDGLGCDFARALAFAVGHVGGMRPEHWEVPYMFVQFYVYGRMKLGDMWDWRNKSRFASWCKAHPPIFHAGNSHGGVTVSVSESGYDADNREIVMTPAMGAELLKGYYTASQEQVTMDFLDCPPTPKTGYLMENEDFPHELFESN